MNRIKNYCRLIGLTVLFGLSNVAFAVCTFDPEVTSPFSAPDGVSDLSGQGNFNCADFIGSGGTPMTEVTGVVFERDGDWELPASAWITDSNGFVKNTPDRVVLFPQGQGSRCDFSYYRNNAVAGTGLVIGGNVSKNNSIACTDDLVNNEEAPPLPEPDIVITGDGCQVTLTANSGSVTQDDFDVFTSTNLEGTRQAICSADGTPQNECVRGCPEFIDIDAIQAGGTYCQPNPDGTIPLTDPIDGRRCTPCLTAVQAEATIPGFDTGVDEAGAPLKLCWEYNNSVNNPDHPGAYKPHKPIRSQTAETDLFNACYQTTVTVNFFGREITRTITTCD